MLFCTDLHEMALWFHMLYNINRTQGQLLDTPAGSR